MHFSTRVRPPICLAVGFLAIAHTHTISFTGHIDASEKSSSSDVAGLLNSSISLDGRGALQVRDDHTCAPGIPCQNSACCGKNFICGFGPLYCGSGCLSNCDAKAPCGEYAAIPGATCPLNGLRNVCCSTYGFCGTTDDFCGNGCQSNCGHPSDTSSGGDVRNRIIGYYEGWAAAKTTCAKMTPDQIPVAGLTHLNFAFAYINPYTFDIIPMADYQNQPDIFTQVTNMKSRQPGLQVWISIGGWSFSDNGTSTQTCFSRIAGSITNRLIFADKLLKFMVQYGFDGADIDWEYPGAPDRGGKYADVANYSEMLKAIKYWWGIFDKPFGLSITAPTSYWYLQWFDLQSIANIVDWINLMTYDLHGIWDSTDPIGPYVYGHTNLTEIDLALELFWRESVPAKMINLGLAFYGRSFQLTDPTCSSPGCPFDGPGPQGICSQTPGILTWKDLTNLFNGRTITGFYDSAAAVNYMAYPSGDSEAWVSYDTSVTFQQKIDYANSKGLAGLFIWAIDQDDDSLTALKGVTGKDLVPNVPQSNTLGAFNLDLCYITDCDSKATCKPGFSTMVHLNLDKSGQGCPGKNHQQRTFCCPAWGAPDPKTCNWRGSWPQCYGQCLAGEVNMIQDNYGNGGHCDHGVKTWCCPATNAQSAIEKCKDSGKKSCPADHPQFIATIGYHGTDFCCPANPVFNNCKWYGSKTSCEGNRCPVGQVEMATSVDGDGGNWESCVLGRQHALCCDPPLSGTPFLPVPLDDLFPETASWSTSYEPEYYESFDTTVGQFPNPNLVANDPNQQSFAWLIVVGEEADVQSLRKRDNSHVEVFDCPNPQKKDFGIQSLKILCSHPDHPESTCEDMLLGGVMGTVVHLPDGCGPDKLVRAVDFKEIYDYELPHHLVRRATYRSKVYELRYDYNFKKLRRDGGPVHIRVDVSDHPGYWDEIVSASAGSSVKKRTPQNWREHDKRWFSEKGLSDWAARFNKLKLTKGYGLVKTYHFASTLYEASKSCPPLATADMYVEVDGKFSVTFDFGITLIGELRAFDFSESYAYFSHNDLSSTVGATIYGNAEFSIQSEVLPLLSQLSLFGADYNIKGILVIGPYFQVDGQVQAKGTLSGEAGMSVTVTAPTGFNYFFPPSLDTIPTSGALDIEHNSPSIHAGTSASISASGAIMISIIPTLGFNLDISAFDKSLANTDIRTSFQNDFILNIGASSGSSCAGINIGIDWGTTSTLTVKSPIPSWPEKTWKILDETTTILNTKCYPWGNSPWRRDLLLNSTDIHFENEYHFIRRDETDPVASSDAVFPDPSGSCLLCPNPQITDTGNCFEPIDLYSDDSGLSSFKRSSDYEGTYENNTYSKLEKRSSKTGSFCENDKQMSIKSPSFDESNAFMKNNKNYLTYGKTNPADCDDVGFGQVAAPPESDSPKFNTEHILEFQLLGIFLQSMRITALYPDVNGHPSPVAAAANKGISWWNAASISYCKYLWFWWARKPVDIPGSLYSTPLSYVAMQFPGTKRYVNEFVLLDKEVNGLKAEMWTTDYIREPTKWRKTIQTDVNKAINTVRAAYFAYLYMLDPTIQKILLAQTKRIGDAFDNIEANVISQLVAAPDYNDKPYLRMDLGNRWRVFMKSRFNYAMRRVLSFMDDSITLLQQLHADPATIPAGNPQNVQPESNPAIVTRIAKLKAALINRPGYDERTGNPLSSL